MSPGHYYLYTVLHKFSVAVPGLVLLFAGLTVIFLIMATANSDRDTRSEKRFFDVGIKGLSYVLPLMIVALVTWWLLPDDKLLLEMLK